MLKLFCLITGDNYQMVKNETPNSRKKVSVMATVLFIPVILWFINGYFLVNEILEGSFYNALLAGAIMSFIIFLIERAIVMATNSILMSVFRIMLGFIIACLGAIVLDEIVFKEDIAQQMVEIKMATHLAHQSKTDSLYMAELDRLQKEVVAKNQIWQIALGDVQKEADGTGGSGSRGLGPVAQLKINLANSKEQGYLASKAELTALQSRIGEEKTENKALVDKSMKESALLNRIKALFQLVMNDPYMMVIYILFTLGILFLEFMVVIIKMSWPKTTYEKRLALLEEIAEKKMDRIRKNNPNYIEIEKAYPQYNTAVNFLNNQKQPTFFN